MSALNRDERQTLRSIQSHLCETILRQGAVCEQIGTIDVYMHPSNYDPSVNYATPHKGVAWVRREDLVAAFIGLENLGRLPRLMFLDSLFPAAFQQQLRYLGLVIEHEQTVLVYRPLYGPALPDEIALGRLPEHVNQELISARIARTPEELATWLSVFRTVYYNTDLITVQPEEVTPLLHATQSNSYMFVTASYSGTPLATARLSLCPPTAGLEVVGTAPHWHGMGLEIALITTAVNSVLSGDCDTTFIVAPVPDTIHLYRRLGFVDMAHILTFWREADAAHHPRALPRHVTASPPREGDTNEN